MRPSVLLVHWGMGHVPSEAKLIWPVEAGSYFEAMSRYYAHRGWGPYTTEEAWDLQPYPRAWEILSDPRAELSLEDRKDP